MAAARTWQNQTDWLTGTPTNLVDRAGDNLLKVPLTFAPALGAGSLGGSAVLSGGNVILPTVSFAGESSPSNGTYHTAETTTSPAGSRRFAQPIIPSSSGYLTAFTMYLQFNTNNHACIYYAKVWSGSTYPAAEIASVSLGQPPFGTWLSLTANFAGSVRMNAGTKYWIGIESSGHYADQATCRVLEGSSGWSGGAMMCDDGPGGGAGFNNAWTVARYFENNNPGFNNLAGSYTFTPDGYSGSWTGPTYDTASGSVAPSQVIISGSFPGGSSGTLYVEGSPDGSSWDVSQAFVNPSGTLTVSVPARRFWRGRFTVTSSAATPTLTAPVLHFPTTSVWVSPVVDFTLVSPVLQALTSTTTNPGGTSVALEIATSPDGSTFTSYGPFVAATPQRFGKVRLTLIGNGAATPTVSNLTLVWIALLSTMFLVFD